MTSHDDFDISTFVRHVFVRRVRVLNKCRRFVAASRWDSYGRLYEELYSSIPFYHVGAGQPGQRRRHMLLRPPHHRFQLR